MANYFSILISDFYIFNSVRPYVKQVFWFNVHIFFETLTTLSGESYDALDRLSDKLPIVDPNPRQEQEWVSTALSQNLGIRAAQEQLTAARRTV